MGQLERGSEGGNLRCTHISGLRRRGHGNKELKSKNICPLDKSPPLYEHGSRTYCDRHRDSNSRYHQRCGHCTSALLLLLLLLLLCPLLDGNLRFKCKSRAGDSHVAKMNIVSCANMLLLGVVAICGTQEMQQVQTEFGPLNVFVEVRCVQQHRSKYLAKKYAVICHCLSLHRHRHTVHSSTSSHTRVSLTRFLPCGCLLAVHTGCTTQHTRT